MFPQFNFYSTPLAILYVWGVIISILLLVRYIKRRELSDLLLAAILLIFTFERTTYTIGFMAWYDTYQNTKVNYFLIPMMLAFGPLVYFYTKRVTTVNFQFSKKMIWHFIPQVILITIRLIIYLYDVNQSGFDDVQNGVLFQSQFMNVFNLITYIITDLSIAIYLLLAGHLIYQYQSKLNEVFSDAVKWEMQWLRNFLIVFILYHVIMFVLTEVDNRIVDISYQEYWWGHLFAAVSLIYLGVHGYFADITKLHRASVDAGALSLSKSLADQNTELIKNDTFKEVEAIMKQEKPYLNSNLTLAELAKMSQLNSQELSAAINQSGINFNDFVNEYRVKAVQKAIQNGRAKEFTLLSIAHESGFNSKATFNRTFKKLTQKSPSEYLKSIEE